ncbi:MAG: YqaA family protein [Patescibacteria group bacterium]
METEIVEIKKKNSWSDRIRLWAEKHADEPSTTWWLALMAFTESFIFPIPADVMLVAILTTSRRWFYYGLVTTVSSVLGGMFGYLIGYAFYDLVGRQIIEFYNFADEMQKVGVLFADNAFWTVLVAAFTPIPDKVMTIAAGFFKISFPVFVIALIFGRGLRFFLVAYLMHWFGPKLGEMMYRYFNVFTTLVALVILGGILILYLL